MSAKITRNASDDADRSVEVNVFDPGAGRGAAPETDLTGYVFISQSTDEYIAATGTMVNKRFPITPASDAIESVDTGTDEATVTGHPWQHGDGPFDADEIIGAVAIGDDVYIIYVDENTVAFAESLEDAYADVRIALAGTETGATLAPNADTKRGIYGKWQYTFEQTETDVAACELSVAILGHATLEGGASVILDQAGSNIWGLESENGVSYGNDFRAMRAVLVGDWVIIDGVKYYKSADGAKDRVYGTRTTTTRTSDVDDLDP